MRQDFEITFEKHVKFLLGKLMVNLDQRGCYVVLLPCTDVNIECGGLVSSKDAYPSEPILHSGFRPNKVLVYSLPEHFSPDGPDGSFERL